MYFQFSHWVVSDSLWSYGLQHDRPSCPSPTPRVNPNLSPLSRLCHTTVSFSVVPFSSLLQSFPASGLFQLVSLCIRWPKYWGFSFSIRPSNEHSGLISFRMDWLDLLSVQGTLKSLLQHHSSSALTRYAALTYSCPAYFYVLWIVVQMLFKLLFNIFKKLIMVFADPKCVKCRHLII